MNTTEAIEALDVALKDYAQGFSIGFNTRAPGLNVEHHIHGRERVVMLTPARVTLDLGFYVRATGTRVQIAVEEATVERCVETALATVDWFRSR